MTLEADIERHVREGATERQILDIVDSRSDSQNDIVRHAEGIDVEPMLSSECDEQSAMYAWLKSLSISAAPEVIATHRFGQNCLMVRRYWACPGEKLIPLRDSGLKLKEDARTRFVADMQRLFDHGKLYPYIRGDGHWLVSEKTGVIVVSPWLLTDARPKDRQEHFEAIERTFARYS